MKYLVCVLAIAMLASMVASSKVRLHLTEVEAQSSSQDKNGQDFFFAVHSRKVYIHDNQSTDSLFAASVKVGANAESLVVDTGASTTWYSSTKTTNDYETHCTETCSKVKGTVADFKSLVHSDKVQTVAKAVKTRNTVTLLNKRDVPVAGVAIDYASDNNVSPAHVKNGPNGVLAFAQNASQNLVNQLHANKKISKRMFAIFFAQEKTDNAYKNFVTIGDYEKYLCTDNVWDSKVHQAYPTVDASFKAQTDSWSIQGHKMKVVDSTQEVDMSNGLVTFDTSSYGYWVPQAFLTSLLKLDAFKTCSEDIKTHVVTCKTPISKLKALKFKFHAQLKEFQVPAAAYASVSPTNSEESILNFKLTTGNEAIFGRQFLSHVYAIFDYDHSTVTLTNVYLSKPDTLLMDSTSRWLIIAFGALFFLISFVALLSVLTPIGNTTAPRSENAKQSGRGHQEKVKQSKVQHQEPVQELVQQSRVQYVQQQPIQYVVQQQPALNQNLMRSVSPVQYVDNRNQYVQDPTLMVSPNQRLQQVTTPPRYR